MNSGRQVFHTMEKIFAIFPHNGKKVSTPWKNRVRQHRDWGAAGHGGECSRLGRGDEHKMGALA
jgi:hypothetical protein